MKYTKNRISRRSRVKHSRKTKYSSSKRKNIRTKIQRGGDFTSEKKENLKKHLNTFLSFRDRDLKLKIIFNKYDLQLIALFILVNELYTTEDQKTQLKKILPVNIIMSNVNILADILPELFMDAKGPQNYIVVSSKTVGYEAKNLLQWIENNKTNGLILDKKNFLKYIVELFNADGSINREKLHDHELKEKLKGAFNYKPLDFNTKSHMSLTNMGLQNMRNMIPSSSSTEDSDILTHMWFKGWPDHGVPKKNEFIKFIKLVYQDIISRGGTTLIHCSAGVGRTGVVYLVLKLMFDHNYNLLDNEDELGEYSGDRITKGDISRALVNARSFRMKLVQTLEQYNFIMDVFNLPHITQAKYNVIPTESNATTIFGKKCTDKNRYSDILPYDDKRVILHTKPVLLECDQYINASHMEPDAFGVDRNVITAQCPTDSTKPDFINMLYHYKVKRIVMVTNLLEKSVNKCSDYTGKLLKDSTNPDYITYYKVFPDTLKKIT